MNTINAVLLILIAVSAGVIWFFLKPIKIWLCENKICGVIVPANCVIPVFQGGSVIEWATPRGLKMHEGKLIENIDPNSKELLSPGNSGDELGIWWTGWFSPFLGYAFPQIKEIDDGRTSDEDTDDQLLMVPANDFALYIEKVRKVVGVSPDKPIAEQYKRFVEAIDSLRRNINRFILLHNVELQDESLVSIAIYATGGIVEDPYAFWVKHGKEAFGIWESQVQMCVSKFLQQQTFEAFFRSQENPYARLAEYLNGPEGPDLSLIGIREGSINWEMEQWEENVDKATAEARQLLPQILAKAKTDQMEAEQGVITAGKRVLEIKAQQKVAEEELKRRLALAGRNSKAKELASFMALANDAGKEGAAIMEQWFRVEGRKATPNLTTLVESGASAGTQLQIRDTKAKEGGAQ